jgi:hypothetical protein
MEVYLSLTQKWEAEKGVTTNFWTSWNRLRGSPPNVSRRVCVCVCVCVSVCVWYVWMCVWGVCGSVAMQWSSLVPYLSLICVLRTTVVVLFVYENFMFNRLWSVILNNIWTRRIRVQNALKLSNVWSLCDFIHFENIRSSRRFVERFLSVCCYFPPPSRQ